MNYIGKLKERLGDFWWYSALLFIACRSGDAIQALIGLWLVPRYVGQHELGAILPLQQLCNLFTAPVMAMSLVFSKYVTTYATRGEYGKVKSFIFDTLCAAGAVFLLCIAAAYWLLPHFYLRLKVVSGMLTVLILLSAFTNNLWNLVHNALQGLKNFRTITLVNFLGAPVRLVTLLVAMPIRALSGYVLGQATPAAASTLIAVFTLRRDLKPVRIDASWRRDLPDIARCLVPVMVFYVLNNLLASVPVTVFRQRLPEAESAAYYILSRFSDVAAYAALSMGVILFPLAAEAHEKGAEDASSLRKTVIGTAASTLLLAVCFTFSAKHVFELVETWRPYRQFAHLLPLMTITMGISSIPSAVASYEIACRRYGLIFFLLAAHFLWVAFLQVFTGYEYFRGVLPDGVLAMIASTGMASLENIAWAQLAFTVPTLAVLPLAALGQRRRRRQAQG